jgi:large subunit ribosomal protein L10
MVDCFFNFRAKICLTNFIGKEEKALPLSKERKNEIVAGYLDILSNSNGFIVIQSTGLTVAQVNTLRKKVRDAQGHYAVVKNTLFIKALEMKGFPVPKHLLKGTVSVAFGMSNLPEVAKAVLDFQKEFTEKFNVTGGIMGKDILDANRVDAVSKLPTLDEIRAQLIGLIVAPAEGIVNVLYAGTAGIVNVIHAYLEEKNGAA